MELRLNKHKKKLTETGYVHEMTEKTTSKIKEAEQTRL